MISTNQFKNGIHIEIDGKIWKIIEFQHVKPGKGGAFVRTKLRRIEDGSVIDKTFRAGEKFRPVRTESKQDAVPLRLRRGGGLHGQPRLRADRDPDRRRSATRCSGSCPTPRSRCSSSTNSRATSRSPSAIEMKVTQTDPGVKGDTASGGGTKPATLESGVVVQVPLFIDEGETIRVDTRNGEYVSRAYGACDLGSGAHVRLRPEPSGPTSSSPRPAPRRPSPACSSSPSRSTSTGSSSEAGLPERALETVLLLVGVLVVSIVGLIPGQSDGVLGLRAARRRHRASPSVIPPAAGPRGAPGGSRAPG